LSIIASKLSENI